MVLNYLSVYLNPAHWSLISFMHCFFFMKCVSHCSLCGSYIDVVVRSTNKYICLWIRHLVTTATTTSYIKYYNSIVTQSAIGRLLLGSESHKYISERIWLSAWKDLMFIWKCSLQNPHIAGFLMPSPISQIDPNSRMIQSTAVGNTDWHQSKINIMFERIAQKFA